MVPRVVCPPPEFQNGHLVTQMSPVSPIRLGLFQVEKDAFGCFESSNCVRPGADTEIVILVLRMLQMPYVIIDLRKEFDVAYDFGSLQKNGSWTGVMQLLVENEIDMCGLSMRMTEERRKAVYFSYPTRYFQSVFIVDRPASICPKTFIFNVFTRNVWIILSISIIISFVIILFLRNIISFLSAKPSTKPATHLSSRSSALFRFVLVVTTFFITQAYQSQMYAFLASPASYQIPFFDFMGTLDYIRLRNGFFTAFDTQSMLCPTETACVEFEKVIDKIPIKRHDSQLGIEYDLNHGGIYQSTIDSAFLSSKVSWLDKSSQKRIIIRDDEGPVHYVGYSFSKDNKKLRDKFNDALMQILPVVPIITGGHGYDTTKSPFQLKYRPQLGPLSIENHLLQEMDHPVAHPSSPHSRVVPLTRPFRKSYCIRTFLRDREMGKHVPSVPIRAISDFRSTSLLIICEPDPGKKSRVKWLKKNFFGTRASGFLGLSHDGRYLVAVKAINRETSVYFFLISPRKAILEQSIRLDTSGLMWQVRTYFPPIGARYIAAYVVDQGQVMAIDPTKSSNLEVSVYIVSPEHTFQLQVSTVVLVVPRHNPRTREKLEKLNVRCHEDGLVLNTGVSLLSLMLTDDFLDDAPERQNWYICATPTTTTLSTTKTTINLDLGESVSITSTKGTLLKDEVPKGFSLSDIKRGKPELTEPGSSVLSLTFSRQVFNLERVVWKCIEHALRQMQEFTGCILCSVRDYEADVNEIVGGVAPVIVLALCEIEVYVNNGQSNNEFFLFSLNIDWNLREGSYRCLNVQRIRKIGTSAAFGNQWWMLDKYPVHYSIQNFFLDNRFIFLGKHIRSLRTFDGAWELLYKDADSLDVGRFQQVELLNMAVQSTSESSSDDDNE